MLPPVLEIYVVWHPGDADGEGIAREIVEHFHGDAFTGLIGGAVEVFVRSAGWSESGGAPRPVPLPGSGQPNGVADARFLAVVPVLGNGMAAAVQEDQGGWALFMKDVCAGQVRHSERVGIFPVGLHRRACDGVLGGLVGKYQKIGGAIADDDPRRHQTCRDLAQSLTQMMSGVKQLKAFISHTKHESRHERANVANLITMVREVIASTRLQQFFDANELQPGSLWADELTAAAASSSAMLAVRTDLYPSREWCQREVLVAKRHGVPVIMMDAMGFREERGSFLMDHVPRVPVRRTEAGWTRADVYRSLDVLVDECLKRTLWARQEELARSNSKLDVAWWAPHAPEPLTLVHWLSSQKNFGSWRDGDRQLRILHPDPALGADEKEVLEQILTLAGLDGRMDVMTPRQLAARGG